MATSVEFTVDRKSLKLAILGVDLLDGIVNHHIGNREVPDQFFILTKGFFFMPFKKYRPPKKLN
jgi:hypothetical protein